MHCIKSLLIRKSCAIWSRRIQSSKQSVPYESRVKRKAVDAVEKDSKLIGYVIFHDYDEDPVEIGLVINKGYWGMGYASALTLQMISKAHAMHKQAVIERVPQQKVTVHLAIKYGFVFHGRRNGLDVYRMKT